MSWLPLTDASPGSICPGCKRGTLFVRSSRRVGLTSQLQYLWCKECLVTLKVRIDRRHLRKSTWSQMG